MKMLSMILSGLLSACCFATEKDDLGSLVEFQAAELRKVIDSQRWSITHDSDSIRIESTFELEVGRRSSPALSLATAPKIRYRIDLRFRPKLPKEEFVKIAHARTENALLVAYGTSTKDDYSKALRVLEGQKLPRYSVSDRVGRSYSVYFTSSDSVTLSFKPVALYAEARGVEGIVDSQLWPNLP